MRNALKFVTSDKLKILLAHSVYQQRGGEDSVVEAEMQLLRSFGHEVIEYLRDNKQIAHMNAANALTQTLWSHRTQRDIQCLVQQHRPNVIHVHNSFPLVSPSIYWTAARLGVPIVQTLHNFRLLCAQATFLRNGRVCEDCLGKLPWRGISRKCYRASLPQSAGLVAMLGLHRMLGSYRNKVTRYIALSEFSRRKFIQAGLPEKRLSVKPNFVTAPPSAEARRSGGLFVGRLADEKGLDVLVRALRSVPQAQCTVIGTGPLQHLVSGQSNIRYLGFQDQDSVLHHMQRAAYLVLPSIAYEQFPRVVAEAYATSLPIIASRLGSLPELVKDGKTGLLFTAGSVTELAEKINFAESEPQVVQDMGQNARAEYEAKYTPERNYAQLMAIYEAAITETNPAAQR